MKLPLLLLFLALPFSAQAQNTTGNTTGNLTPAPNPMSPTPVAKPLPASIKTISVNSTPKSDKAAQSQISELLSLARLQYTVDDNSVLSLLPTKRGKLISGKVKTVVSSTEIIIENQDVKTMTPTIFKNVGMTAAIMAALDGPNELPGSDGLIHYHEVPNYPMPTEDQVLAALKSGQSLKVVQPPSPLARGAKEMVYTLKW